MGPWLSGSTMVFITWLAILVTSHPSIKPKMAPTSPMQAASTKKMNLISFSLPPTAFMTPISRVLSRMDISMVLIIPRAAMISAIVPMAPSMLSMIRNTLLISSSSSARAKTPTPMASIFSLTEVRSSISSTLTYMEL